MRKEGVRMRKRRVATAAVVAAMVGVLGFSVPAFAAGGYGSVKVTKNEAEKTITMAMKPSPVRSAGRTTS